MQLHFSPQKAPRRLPIAVLALLAGLVSYLTIRFAVVADDVVWQLWAGAQLNHGFALYTDLKEPNPPLWFWFGAAATALASVLNCAAVPVYFSFVTFAGWISIFLLWKLTADITRHERAIWTMSYAAMLLVVGFFAFGQREHLFALGAMPYAALIAARLRRQELTSALVAATAMLAAFGFALKHYFLLTPVALELLMIAQLRRQWRPRLEHVILILCALGYALAVFRLTPEFLDSTIAEVCLTYSHFNNPVSFILPSSLLVCAGIYLALRTGGGDKKLVQALAVTAASATAVYAIQQKGWMYHEMAMMIAVLTLSSASTIISMRKAKTASAITSPSQRTGLITQLLFTLLCLSYCITFGIRNMGAHVRTPSLLVPLKPGQTVAMLSAAGGDYLHYALKADAQWGQGHLMLWPLPAIAHAESENRMTPQLQKIADDLRKALVNDMLCQPPDILLESSGHTQRVMGDHRFDYIGFFSKDARFRSLLAHYALVGAQAHLNFYRQTKPVTAAAGCRPYVRTRLFPK